MSITQKYLQLQNCQLRRNSNLTVQYTLHSLILANLQFITTNKINDLLILSIIILNYITVVLGHDVGCRWVPVRGSLCFGAKLTQRACQRDLPRNRKRMREGKVPEQNSSEQKKAEQGSQQNRAVVRSRGKPAVRERRLLGPVDPEAGLAKVRGWVSVTGGCVGISLEYTLTTAHRCIESYTKVSQASPFLHLELTQVRDCLFFFSSTLSVVYVVSCVFVKQCEMPEWPDERNH